MNLCRICGQPLDTTANDGYAHTACKNKETPKINEFEIVTPLNSGGWICQRCQNVHAPWVSKCTCTPPTITRTFNTNE